MSDDFHPKGVKENDIPYAVQTENTMRKKLGANVNLKDTFTKELISECEQLIENAKADFFEEALPYLLNIEKAFSEASTNPEIAASRMRDIAKQTSLLKTKMETIGIALGYSVTDSLYNFTQNLSSFNETHMLAISKHIEVLNRVMRDKMSGDGGQMGAAMLDGLKRLVYKTRLSA